MSLILYSHPMSQPGRAVQAFLLLNKIPHEVKVVEPGKRGTQKAEYNKINPLGKIPAIDDNGFLLGESEAIVRYIMNTRKTADHFYPSDAKQRALIDKFFPFYHTIFRPSLIKYFFSSYPFLKGNVTYVTVPVTKEEAKPETEAACRKFEEVFLQGRKFILGDTICVADLFAANEFTQIYYTTDFDFSAFPASKAYIERCLQIPELDELQKTVRGFKEEMKKAMERKAQKKAQEAKL